MVPSSAIKSDRQVWWHVTLIALLAVLARIPMWLSTVHLTFDEGVFLASTDLANSGLTQYRDFFSSQGPLFIPLLQLGDLVGFGDPRAARTVMVVSGVAIGVAVYYITSAQLSRSAGLALGVVAAVSGAVLHAAGPVQSEGPALALALSALAVVMWRHDRVGVLLAGALLGGAVAIKSLHIIPTMLMVPAILAYRREWLNIAYATLAGFAVAGGSALFYGVERVWDQYVLFHLAKDNTVNLFENLAHAGRFLVEYDLVVVALVVAALVVPKRFQPSLTSSRPDLAPPWFGWIWLALTVVVIVGFTRIDAGFVRLMAFFIPPLLAVVAGMARIPTRFLTVAAAASVVFLGFTIDYSHQPPEETLVAVDALADIRPGSVVVADDPGMVWMAGRLSHRVTVDPSYARFTTGSLTADAVAMAASHPDTCAFLSVSERFDTFGVQPPNQYLATDIPGLYLRPGC